MSDPITIIEELVAEAASGSVANRTLWIQRGRLAIEAIYGESSEKVSTFGTMAIPGVVMSEYTVLSGEFAAAEAEAIADASAMLTAILESATYAESGEAKASVRDIGDRRTVFLVHGRDKQNSEAMTQLLESMGLRVVQWEQAVARTGNPNAFVGDIVNAGIEMSDGVVVLLTPDDEVRLRPDLVKDDDPPDERELRGQPRPNVVYEAGLAMAVAPLSTVFVALGSVKIHSDLSGRHLHHFDGSPASRNQLASRLRTARLTIEEHSDRYLAAGSFTNTAQRPQSLDESAARSAVDEMADGTSSEEPASESLGTLEIIAAMEDSLPRIVEHMEQLGQGAETISGHMQDATADAASSDGTAKARLRIAVRLASQIDLVADNSESLALSFHEDVATTDAGIRVLFDQFATSELAEDEKEVVIEALNSIIIAASSAASLAGSIAEGVTALKDIGQFARPLRKTTSRLVGAYSFYAESLLKVDEWGTVATAALEALEGGESYDG